MAGNNVLNLQLQVHEDDADAERIEQLTRTLIRQLRELDIELIDRMTEGQAALGKGDPLTIGTVLLALSVASIPSLVALLQRWVGDNRRVSVEAPNGVKLEFTPKKRYSEDEIVALIERLNRLS